MRVTEEIERCSYCKRPLINLACPNECLIHAQDYEHIFQTYYGVTVYQQQLINIHFTNIFCLTMAENAYFDLIKNYGFLDEVPAWWYNPYTKTSTRTYFGIIDDQNEIVGTRFFETLTWQHYW